MEYDFSKSIEENYDKALKVILQVVEQDPTKLSDIYKKLADYMIERRQRVLDTNNESVMQTMVSIISRSEIKTEKDFVDYFLIYQNYWYHFNSIKSISGDCLLIKNRFKKLKEFILEKKPDIEGRPQMTEKGKKFIKDLLDIDFESLIK